VLDRGGTTIATYSFVNGWPRKYVAAEVHAGSDNDVAVEKITIAHEGFVRVANEAEPPAGGE
jgi:phage tail-like protein